MEQYFTVVLFVFQFYLETFTFLNMAPFGVKWLIIIELCSSFLVDGADGNWGRWSSCVCKHDLNLERGVRYRVPKCRFLCPNEQSCPDKIQFDSAACPCNSVGTLHSRYDFLFKQFIEA